jgi:hypothetical protein
LVLQMLLIAMVSFPVVASLVRLQTGNRLADWPAGATLLLVLVWWLCLHWSLVGFVALLLVSIAALLQLTRYLQSIGWTSKAS